MLRYFKSLEKIYGVRFILEINAKIFIAQLNWLDINLLGTLLI